MGMMEAVNACFDKYADFEGRSRRSEFWYFRLFQLIVILGLMMFALIGAAIHEFVTFTFAGLAVLIYYRHAYSRARSDRTSISRYGTEWLVIAFRCVLYQWGDYHNFWLYGQQAWT